MKVIQLSCFFGSAVAVLAVLEGCSADAPKPVSPPVSAAAARSREVADINALASDFDSAPLLRELTVIKAGRKAEPKPCRDEDFFHLDVAYAEVDLHPALNPDYDAGGPSERGAKSKTAFVRTYNKQVVGPIIEVRPGQKLCVELTNHLPEDPDDPSPRGPAHHHNGPHGYNVTNLHVHGLHVSPDYPSWCKGGTCCDSVTKKCAEVADNVFVQVIPGQSQRYQYELDDKHPPGTHWYHAHKHGSTATHLASGMAGPLIVRSKPGEPGLDNLPEILSAHEEIMVFQQLTLSPCGRRESDAGPGECDLSGLKGSSLKKYESSDAYFKRLVAADAGLTTFPAGVVAVENFDVSFGFGQWANHQVQVIGNRTSINGELVPRIDVKQNQLQRWRLIDGGIREQIKLAVMTWEDFKKLVNKGKDVNKDDDEEVRKDRVDLHVVAYDGITLSQKHNIDALQLEPGYRADVLFTLPKKEDYVVLDLPVKDVDSLIGQDEPLQLLARVHVEGPIGPPGTLPEDSVLAKLAPYHNVADSEVTGCQYNTFNIVTGPRPQFQVNGHAFNPDAPPRQAKLGAADEWMVRSALGEHPFHIHVNPFEIVDGTGQFPAHTWKDTLIVRKGQDVRLRTRYEDFTGKFVLHCHILDHEDEGMMQAVEIVQGSAEVCGAGAPQADAGGRMCKEPPADGGCP